VIRAALVFALLSSVAAADDHWVRFTSGPFEVLTDAGAHAGRETLVRFEEFRNAVGQIVGEQDLQTPQTIRILVFRNPRGWTLPTPVAQGRDRYNIVLAEKGGTPPAVWSELTRLLLHSNTARMPAAFEHGLVEFFSTIRVDGIRITAGAPPGGPAGTAPDLDWARIHLLAVDPEYYGKLRVLLYNLRKGVDEGAAYRNAFGKAPGAVESQAKQHLAAGNFQTTTISSRPMAEEDFPERPVSDADARLARADLLAGSQSADEYQGLLRDHLKVAEAEEGLGLLALGSRQEAEARRHFEAAMQAGTASPRCYIEYARLEPDNEKATEALLKAAGINPKLDEPFALMARRDTDPRKRLAHWKAAAERDPRNASYWQSLAECYLAEHNYGEAAKAWTAGEQAAADPAERARMRQARLSIEQQRLDYEAAEKKRQADEDAREVEKLKQEARAEVRQLEARYSDGKAADKPVPWWDGPKPAGKITGMLVRVDCLGKQARLVIRGEDNKTVRLLVTDPGKVALAGPGELSLGCGAQKPRRVSVEYFPKPNARLATAGEAAMIEFQ
jgi:hypothetical protein